MGNGTAGASSRRPGEIGKTGAVSSASAKSKDVRLANVSAAKAVADAIRTSLGPRGMDKMIQGARGDVLITNDGATILEKMRVEHPAAKMVSERVEHPTDGNGYLQRRGAEHWARPEAAVHASLLNVVAR